MFSAPLQHITVAELTSLMAIACAVSVKFKIFFLPGQLKVIPLFRYSVQLFRIPCFTDSHVMVFIIAPGC